MPLANAYSKPRLQDPSVSLTNDGLIRLSLVLSAMRAKLETSSSRVCTSMLSSTSIAIWTNGPQLSEWILHTEPFAESTFDPSASVPSQTFFSPITFLTSTRPRPRGHKSERVAPPTTLTLHSYTLALASNIGA